jgi:hypothetical protein
LEQVDEQERERELEAMRQRGEPLEGQRADEAGVIGRRDTYATEEEARAALAQSVSAPSLHRGNERRIENPNPEWPDSRAHIGAEDDAGRYRGTVFRNEYTDENGQTHTYYTYARGDH